ncbi:conserved transmembrane domain protein [Mycobacterium ulcerans str. Harvey]|uniref:Conserved transmembrane domain protein n=1 Tax=Mycobacterium ulcerans str. Harvey TaxID=1299332 RepID=A0ABP3AMF8_MYCUL|nr:conserved transmembrane domain protein [Mycobacterium ulcerans str. Harvey]
MLNTWNIRALGAALITSSLAVAIGSLVTHDRPELDWPSAESTYLLSAHALALAPVAFVVGVAFNRIMAAARPASLVRSWTLIPASPPPGWRSASVRIGGRSYPATARASSRSASPAG